MDSSHATPQDQCGLKTRAHQRENECSELKRECENLLQTNSALVQNQLMGDSKMSELEGGSLKSSLDKAEAKKNYFKIRHKNRHWKYPLAAPTIPELRSYGYDESDSEVIVDVITEMIDTTTKMRRGERILRLNIGSYLVQHWEGMLPHYKELTDAMAEYRHTIEYHRDDEFRFSLHGPLPREVLDLVQEALRQTHFYHLAFSGEKIVDVGYIDFISKCVASDTRLKELVLLDVRFEPGDIDVFCQAVNSHDSLRQLLFNPISFESHEENFHGIMSKLKSKSLENIIIRHDLFSGLRPADMDFLVSNPSLKLLKFEGKRNPFSEDDFVIMQDALRNNKTLSKLSFVFLTVPNNFYLGCLVPLVFDRTSLNSAYESNHHCILELFSRDINGWNTKQINTGNEMWNRKKKIYTILSSRNMNRQNAAHFESDDISIKHIPQILSILKPFSEHALYNEDYDTGDEHEVTPLSIAYEILRDWKMPELYSYLNLVDE